ncbi:prevent-host-death family protein [Leptothrix cholodnii SP-6]|uniref:Antitoxin n=1 Tax=Leptothrix cholodnii (strain ATCC 51168 / LMG 8142 / SP-6) TaxID=395495 RepID=B1XWG5_LEPCP|nr:type II toxin-antitoxin system prevent-host-death family antitoxin [Leptothrix cholodnii]ACB33833.1 prevent-host-death family protein [Leptothrix cholodnii SP-6]
MSQYNIAQAKAQFSELVQRALAGEEVVIARDNRPLLRLMPLATTGKPRAPGSAKTLVKSIAADFDAPLDDLAEYR